MSASQPLLVGWREWVALPALDVPAIKAKVDTGARTSAIHAFDIALEEAEDRRWVSFSVLPLQRNSTIVRRCRAPLVDQRSVTDSGGHVESRYVVSTDLQVGSVTKTIEMTLTERHNMLFRMLIGRTALAGHMWVDPAKSFVNGRLAERHLYT